MLKSPHMQQVLASTNTSMYVIVQYVSFSFILGFCGTKKVRKVSAAGASSYDILKIYEKD